MTVLSDPAAYAWAVTPSDSTDLSATPRALYVGTGGNIAIKAKDPSNGSIATVSLVNVPSGSLLPVRASRIMSTGTTATNIVALT